MNSNAELATSIYIVKLSGRLDADKIINNSASLIGEIPDSASAVLLNISEVSFIDSSGLGYLVSIYKQLAAENRQMVICEPTTQARMLFELTRMYQIFSIFDDEDLAIETLL